MVDEKKDGNPIEEPQDEKEEVEVAEDVIESETREEEKFIDPSQLPSELIPHFKRMQASFTRRMQQLSSEKDKIALYDKLMEDPKSAISILAERAGLKISEGKKDEQPKQDESETAKWIKSIVNEAIGQALEEKVQPLRAEQVKVKIGQVISYLNSTYPDWGLYEDTMAEIVKKHPSMQEDVDTLYEMAKMATLRVEEMKKQAVKKPSSIGKPSAGGRTIATPTGKLTIDEAFQLAKKAQGL